MSRRRSEKAYHRYMQKKIYEDLLRIAEKVKVAHTWEEVKCDEYFIPLCSAIDKIHIETIELKNKK